MALNTQDFVMVTFPCGREVHKRFKRMYPRYGDTSKVLRYLVEQLVSGGIRVPRKLI